MSYLADVRDNIEASYADLRKFCAFDMQPYSQTCASERQSKLADPTYECFPSTAQDWNLRFQLVRI